MKPHHPPRRRRRPAVRFGYALPFVIVMLMLLAVALSSMLFVLAAGARSTESMVGRRKAFYVCDGLGRLATIAAADYFAQLTGAPQAADLKAHVVALANGTQDANGQVTLPGFFASSPGYELTDFDIKPEGTSVVEPLSSGPFAGMPAVQNSVSLSLGAKRTTTGSMCRQEQSVTLGKIAMFQFFVFSDQDYTDWTPGPDMASTGRVHANGTVCLSSIASGKSLWIERITAAGDIVHSSNSGCRAGTYTPQDHPVKIAKVASPVFDLNPGNSNLIEPNPDHFANFDGDSRTQAPGWAQYARSTYNDHLLDAAHGVTKLRLPVMGGLSVQRGYDAAAATPPVVDNSSTRLLVDPVLSGDTSEARRMKLAYKADLRIINGVWYLRDPNNPDAWPGTPIWSDHPGNFTTVAEEGVQPSGVAVGQNQLASARSWGVHRPKRFSYYRFNADGDLLVDAADPAAVLSYGLLARDAGTGSEGPIWQPALRCNQTPTPGSLAAATSTADACAAASANASDPDSVGERLLRGTRSGFVNSHLYAFEQDSTGTEDCTQASSKCFDRSNVLPVNFDVAAFQHALASTAGRELGSYFSTASHPEPFNGIVWISSTWPGASSQPSATLGPLQKNVDDANQPARIVESSGEQYENQALPYPLCTGSTGSDAADSLAGHEVLDEADTDKNTGFKIPSCATYVVGNPMNAARPHALRIYNARNVNSALGTTRPILPSTPMLPSGLTIVTNLPVYVLGDVNLGSDPDNLAGTSPWVPLLVAGDIVYTQSNAWSDHEARWSKPANGNSTAEATGYNMQVLTGWNPTPSSSAYWSGSLQNILRLHENWANQTMRFRGSIVVGWASVYNRARLKVGAFAGAYRDWGFDRHLESLAHQPPGSPTFDVAAVRQWKR
jgi:hypothetical protein